MEMSWKESNPVLYEELSSECWHKCLQGQRDSVVKFDLRNLVPFMARTVSGREVWAFKWGDFALKKLRRCCQCCEPVPSVHLGAHLWQVDSSWARMRTASQSTLESFLPHGEGVGGRRRTSSSCPQGQTSTPKGRHKGNCLSLKQIWGSFWVSLDCKEIQPVHPKGNLSWIFIGRTDVEAETPILGPPDTKNWLIGKDPDAGKDWRREEKGTTEDEMAGWHHRLDGHEFWVNSGSWWWTGRPGVLQSLGSQRVRHYWAPELNWTEFLRGCPEGLDPVVCRGSPPEDIPFGFIPQVLLSIPSCLFPWLTFQISCLHPSPCLRERRWQTSSLWERNAQDKGEGGLKVKERNQSRAKQRVLWSNRGNTDLAA